MKILLSGSSGLVGSALTESLFAGGHTITCLQRNKSGQGTLWNTEVLDIDNPDTFFDVVIHLAGENIAEGRWTTAKKKRIVSSRINGTRELVDFLTQHHKAPTLILAASAVGFYGNRPGETLNEMSNKGTGFLSDICLDWEKEVNKLEAYGSRVVNLRFGMVLSPKGGALHKMLPAFKAGVGGMIASGMQHVSWVSIRDIAKIVSFIIEDETLHGPINVVSSHPTTNEALTKSLGKILHKPTFFKVPAFVAKILFGTEMTNEMLLTSTRATPEKLISAGYKFIDPALENALTFCLNSKKTS